MPHIHPTRRHFLFGATIPNSEETAGRNTAALGIARGQLALT